MENVDGRENSSKNHGTEINFDCFVNYWEAETRTSLNRFPFTQRITEILKWRKLDLNRKSAMNTQMRIQRKALKTFLLSSLALRNQIKLSESTFNDFSGSADCSCFQISQQTSARYHNSKRINFWLQNQEAGQWWNQKQEWSSDFYIFGSISSSELLFLRSPSKSLL